MAENSSSSSGGIGFLGLLTVVLVVLKILGKITWPWWWVLAPIWMGWAFVLAVLGLIAFIAGAIAITKR